MARRARSAISDCLVVQLIDTKYVQICESVWAVSRSHKVPPVFWMEARTWILCPPVRGIRFAPRGTKMHLNKLLGRNWKLIWQIIIGIWFNGRLTLIGYTQHIVTSWNSISNDHEDTHHDIYTCHVYIYIINKYLYVLWHWKPWTCRQLGPLPRSPSIR